MWSLVTFVLFLTTLIAALPVTPFNITNPNIPSSHDQYPTSSSFFVYSAPAFQTTQLTRKVHNRCAIWKIMHPDEPCPHKQKNENYLVASMLRDRGFSQINAVDTPPVNLTWVRVGMPTLETNDYSDSFFRPFTENAPERLINRYPSVGHIINAKRSLAELTRNFEDDYDIPISVPDSFLPPEDLDQLIEYCEENPDSPLIRKPDYGGKGNNIQLFQCQSVLNDPSVFNNSRILLQKYITNPYLINKRKFTIRLYVLISSIDPLVLYLYDQGVVKFTSSDFQTTDLDDAPAHIANENRQLESDQYSVSDDINKDNVGNRWSVTALKQYFIDNHGSSAWDLIWDNIKKQCIRTIAAAQPQLLLKSEKYFPQHRLQGFQILGVDFDLLDNLKPILLEMNVNPALDTSSAPFDTRNRIRFLNDTFDMMSLDVQLDRVSNIKSFAAQITTPLRALGFFDLKFPGLVASFLDRHSKRGNWELIFPSVEKRDETVLPCASTQNHGCLDGFYSAKLDSLLDHLVRFTDFADI